VCAGSIATFTASGAATYSWSTGSTNAVLQNTPGANTTYILTGTNTAGCSNSISASVVVNPVPVITFSLSSAAICAGETATINASGANTYSWSTGPTSSSLAVNPSTTTVYVLTAFSSANCTSTAQVTQIVNLCTGIQGLSKHNPEYLIFPNPTKDFLTITFGDENRTDVSIVCSTGAVIYKNENYVSGTSINCSNLAKGMYFVRINSLNTQVLKKLVIE